VTGPIGRVVAVVGCLAAGAVVVTGDAGATGAAGTPQTVEVKHGGLKRTALVYVPSYYDGSRSLPLVLSFHGRYGQGVDQAALTQLHVIGEREEFIVAYPDGFARSWNALHGTGEAQQYGVDDVGFVDALVAALSAQYRIDPDRIYASGMSNGGFFTHRLGCERSSRLAAIATVAGELGTAMASVCRPSDPLPVLSIHGTYDVVVPYLGGALLDGGSTLSARQTAEAWARSNGSMEPPRETFRAGRVVCHTVADGSSPTTLCTVDGGGHTWPGGQQYASDTLVGATNQDISASEMIWQFFRNHPRTAKKPQIQSPKNLRFSIKR
jgi:polyhydroxybutyrate depolymerase